MTVRVGGIKVRGDMRTVAAGVCMCICVFVYVDFVDNLVFERTKVTHS